MRQTLRLAKRDWVKIAAYLPLPALARLDVEAALARDVRKER